MKQFLASTNTAVLPSRRVLLAVVIAVMLVLTACSGSDDAAHTDLGGDSAIDGESSGSGDDAPGGESDGDTGRAGVGRDGADGDETEPDVRGEDVAGELLDRLGPVDGIDDESAGDDDATSFEARLAELLVPEGIDVDDPAFAEALAARLGPDFAGVTDVDVLIEELIEELGLEPGEEIGADDLLDAVEAWASDGVVRLGTSDGANTISATTSFADARSILDGARPTIDLIPGLTALELRDVEIATDTAGRSITIQGHLPAPISSQAAATITWTGSTPTVAIELRRPSLTIADLVDRDLGPAGSIGFDGVTLRLSGDAIALSASIDPSRLPGAAAIELPASTLPISAEIPGLGVFGAGSPDIAFDLEIPISLDPIATWNTSRSGVVTIGVSREPSVRYEETWATRLGDDRPTFVGSVELGGDTRALTMTMRGDWPAPFGVDWLTLRDVTLAAGRSGSGSSASIEGGFQIGAQQGRLSFAVADDGSASATGSLERLTLDDLAGFARTVAGSSLVPDGLDLPDDLFVLEDVTLSMTTAGGGRSVSLAAATELLGNRADAVFAVVPRQGGGHAPVLSITPRGMTLGSLLPVLADQPSVGGIAIPESAIVLTGGPIAASPSAFPAELQDALSIPTGSSSGAPFRLAGGISLSGVIPGGTAPGLDDVKEALGMDRDAPMRIGGTLPLAALTGGSATEFALDLSLPEMRPAGSPAWFVAAQLSVRVTGEPSVGIVGSLTMDLAGDIQTFEVEMAVSGGPDASFEIIGRLGNPWVTPFDVEWLTLDEVVLKLGVDARGSVTIGFLADMDIGSKDIRGAMAISVNAATGAPTNFAFEAESAAGVSMGDLADLYALMSGEPRPPVEAALPAAEVRNLAIRFAPQADPDLGIEQGFRMAGELWMGDRPGAPLELLVGVDIEIAVAGIAVEGYLTDLTLGPIEFDETSLSIAISAAEQRFAFSGGAEIADQAVSIELELTPTTMSFGTTLNVNGGRARMLVTASLDMLDPRFEITAIMDEQFLRNVDASLQATLGRQVTDINQTISDARRDIDRITPLLRSARRTLDSAQDAVDATGCWGPFKYLCDRVSAARSSVRSYERQLSAAQTQLARAERLLDRYDIQLTLVGADFTAAWAGFDAGRVTMVLQVDANGLRVPVDLEWDFNRSIDDNLDGVLDRLV